MILKIPEARVLHNIYNCNKPFPHILLSKAIDEKHILEVAKEFSVDVKKWRELGHKNVRAKFYNNNPKTFGIYTRELVEELQSKRFCKWLGGLTGYRNVISDPALFGGGLHAIGRGGRLAIHADFNYSKQLKSRRILNLLLYLNDPWDESWGGALELWSKDMRRKEVEVAPLLNNMVIFNTDSDSNHGHPHPLNCPEGVFRKSIALYYYNEGEQVENIHSTLYREPVND